MENEKIKVWVVYADDHDYDQMSQWLVGVFTTHERAQQEADAEPARYHARTKNGEYRCNVEVFETTLDELTPL